MTAAMAEALSAAERLQRGLAASGAEHEAAREAAVAGRQVATAGRDADADLPRKVPADGFRIEASGVAGHAAEAAMREMQLAELLRDARSSRAGGRQVDRSAVEALEPDAVPVDVPAEEAAVRGTAAKAVPAAAGLVMPPRFKLAAAAAGPADVCTAGTSATGVWPMELEAGLSALQKIDCVGERLLGSFPAALRDWALTGRLEQKPPEGEWRTWLLLGGRGSGKTRAGAEWVHAVASAGQRSDLRIALVAETLGDAREVMIDGISGICRIARRNRPEFEISRRRLVWPNGAVAQVFSSEDPESLRGPQFHMAWCDELAKWKHGQETWDMLQFGLRLGNRPQQLVTTTPRPVPLLKALIADEGTRLARISTRANSGNLAPGFIKALDSRYGGTRLGRQELDGELIEDRDDALWKRGQIEALAIRFTGTLRRIVVAVDPPATAGTQSCCGIVVAGVEVSGRAVVLADCSVEGASPAGWAGAVVRAYHRFGADRVIAEINQGGDMVQAMLRSIDASLPVSTVRATRGKFLRAEPVAALYEQGRVAHAGRFTALEDQMCDFGPDGLSNGRSPDRLDALVWALTALMLEGGGEPRVRGI